MTNHTAWMVKFVLNLVLLTFFDLCKLVDSKGQLISKCLFGVFNFFQKTNENKLSSGIVVVKLNSFVVFLEEFTAWQFAFQFY